MESVAIGAAALAIGGGAYVIFQRRGQLRPRARCSLHFAAGAPMLALARRRAEP